MCWADGRVDGSAGEPTKHKFIISRRYKMPDPILIQYGNQYNVPVKTYYIESDSDVSSIPASEPAGTIAEVNESGNFHVLMKNKAGTWETL